MYYDKQETMAEITLIIKSKEKKINKYNALKKKAVEKPLKSLGTQTQCKRI